MNGAESTTLIGKSVKIVGDLSGSEDLTIEGEIHGTIRLGASRLTIGRDARVRGDVAAKEVIVFGRIEGDIRATGRTDLRSSAVVMGNVFSSTLSMEENAVFRGRVDPSRAGEPLPEPSIPALVSRPAGYSPADERGSSLTRGSSQLPAALAAVAAARTAAVEPQSDSDEARQSNPLFASTEA